MANGVNLTDAVINRAARQVAMGLETVGVDADIALHQGYVLVQRFQRNTPGEELQAPFTHLYKRAALALEVEGELDNIMDGPSEQEWLQELNQLPR